MRLRWQSLRTRLVAGVLCATVLALWLAAFVVGRQLRQDMEQAISAQQFSTVALIAAEIDRSVKERLAILDRMAASLAVGAAGALLAGAFGACA